MLLPRLAPSSRLPAEPSLRGKQGECSLVAGGEAQPQTRSLKRARERSYCSRASRAPHGVHPLHVGGRWSHGLIAADVHTTPIEPHPYRAAHPTMNGRSPFRLDAHLDFCHLSPSLPFWASVAAVAHSFGTMGSARAVPTRGARRAKGAGLALAPLAVVAALCLLAEGVA